jgi:hypothetical protein
MIGILGQRAHPAGRDVQDVRFDPRAVGDSTADGAEPVHEGDPSRTLAAEEMGGDRDAAEAAADDSDRKRRARFLATHQGQGGSRPRAVRRALARHSAETFAPADRLPHSGLRPELYFSAVRFSVWLRVIAD